MKKGLSLLAAPLFLSLVFGTVLTTTQAPISGQTMQDEMKAHPRIAVAIEKLEDAINYLKNAPMIFGGHKAAAVADCERAVKQLKLALEYRMKEDAKKKKK